MAYIAYFQITYGEMLAPAPLACVTFKWDSIYGRDHPGGTNNHVI